MNYGIYNCAIAYHLGFVDFTRQEFDTFVHRGVVASIVIGTISLLWVIASSLYE